MARSRYPSYLAPLKYSRAIVYDAAAKIQTAWRRLFARTASATRINAAVRGFHARFRRKPRLSTRGRGFRINLERRVMYQRVFQKRRIRQKRENDTALLS